MLTIQNSVDFWNLDWLSKGNLIKGRGRALLVSAPRLASDDRSVLTGNGRIVILRRERKVLQLLSRDGDVFALAGDFRWGDKEDFVDIAYADGSLFALDVHKREITAFSVTNHGLHLRGNLWLGEHIGDRIVGQDTRLVPGPSPQVPRVGVVRSGIVRTGYSGTVMKDMPHAYLYVGPVEDRYIYGIDVRQLQAPSQVIDLEMVSRDSRLDPPIGPDIHFTVNRAGNSIMIADMANCRIVEVALVQDPPDPPFMLATVLAGDDGIPLRFTSVGAIAAYSAHNVSEFLNSKSQQILATDATKSRLRTILVADPARSMVRKIVEIPMAAQIFLPGIPTSHTCSFVGNGNTTKKLTPVTDQALKDLGRFAIAPPVSIDLSTEGELLVQMEGQESLLLLSPATARTRQFAIDASNRHDLIDS